MSSMRAALEIVWEGRPRPALPKAPCLAPNQSRCCGVQQLCLERRAEPGAGRELLNRRPTSSPLHRPLLLRPPWPGAGDVFHLLLCKFHPAVSSSSLELNFSEDATSSAPVQKKSRREPLEGTATRRHVGWNGCLTPARMSECHSERQPCPEEAKATGACTCPW